MPRIKHIEFWVSNLTASAKFYEQFFPLIGWGKIDANSFSDGETKIYLIEQPVAFEKSIGPRHICFLADSQKVVDEVGTFLNNNQYPIIRGPISASYEDRSYYTVDFKDPDSYILEVATKSELSK